MTVLSKIKALWNLPEKLSRIETEILVLSQTAQRIEHKLHEFYGQVLPQVEEIKHSSASAFRNSAMAVDSLVIKIEPQVEDIRRVSQMYLEKTTKETVGEFMLVKARKELLKGKANGKAKATRTK